MLLPTEYVKPIKPRFSSKIEQEGGRNLPVDDPYEAGMRSAVAQSNTEVLLTKILQDFMKTSIGYRIFTWNSTVREHFQP